MKMRNTLSLVISMLFVFSGRAFGLEDLKQPVQESVEILSAYLANGDGPQIEPQGSEYGLNTYYGQHAGLNSSGASNSFFGNETGRYNLGDYNTAAGLHAGMNNRADNVCLFGSKSGVSNQGANNSFFGTFSGTSIIPGQNIEPSGGEL